MPDHGVNLTEEQREILAPLAYDYSAKGWPRTRIAERLGINRHTVRALIRREQQVRKVERTGEKEEAIARYERIVERAWDELTKPQSNGLAIPALLNAIANAQSKIDQITGVRAPLKSKTQVETWDLSKLTDEQLDKVNELGDQMQEIIQSAITAESPHEN